MKRLYIAEKPSLGRAIAAVLPGPLTQGHLSITAANGDIVTWAAGHILQPAPPDYYAPELKAWRLDTLPIVPSDWSLVPSPKATDLLDNIESLLKKASEVVNAGDADREGQLLIDEILQYFHYSGPVKRLFITDTSPAAIGQAISEMKDNALYQPLSEAALCRQKADWMLGMSLSRLFTLKAQEKGSENVVSVGRVQTPTLGLVVTRDRIIDNFKPVSYWLLKGTFATAQGERFTATWRPKDDQPGLDPDGHLIDQAVMEDLQKRLSGVSTATLADVKREQKKKAPPLPHNLPSLQIECSKRFGLSPTDTLAIVQGLYERGLVTYPRSDCPYLPTARHSDAQATFQAILATAGADELKSAIDGANPADKTAAWDDSKVAEHFALIPTTSHGALQQNEKDVYVAIARRYIAQFLGPYCYESLGLTIDLGGEQFTASATAPLSLGWKGLYDTDPDAAEEKTDKEPDQVLPDVATGEELQTVGVEAVPKKTTPPSRFTEATLLQAMNNIHKFVTDPEIKKILKDVEGIGTAATQAKIIETILVRGYVTKEKKFLVSTPLGQALIDAVSPDVAKPDLTAIWERQLSEVHHGQLAASDFLAKFVEQLRHLVETGKTSSFGASVAPAHPCPACQGPLRQRKGKNGLFWACAACSLTLDDDHGKPAKTIACPSCGKVMIRRSGKNGFFWACKCGLLLNDVRGKPQKTTQCTCGAIAKLVKGKNGDFWSCTQCKKTWSGPTTKTKDKKTTKK